MPRDLLRQLITERALATRVEIQGEIVSGFRLVEFDTNKVLMPCANVKIDQQIIENVPVAANNRELLEAQPGTPVTLHRSASGRLEITGLSKRAFGNRFSYTMTIPRSIPLNSGVPVFISSLPVLSVAVSGFFVRSIQLDELETISGFGVTLFQAFALFDVNGNFVQYA